MTYGPPPGDSGGHPPDEPGGQPHPGPGQQPGPPGGHQPGPYQGPPQPGYQSPFAQGSQKSAAAGVLAPSSTNPMLRFAGIALAVAALMLVLFSFFSWASSSDEGASVSITGMGSVSVDFGETPSEFESVEGFEMPSTSDFESELEKDTSAPGVYTIVLGILLGAAALALIINRYPGVGAIAAVVLALAAVAMALIFISDPGSAVVTGNAGDTSGVDPGWGLWLVTVGALVALVAGGLAVYLALTSTPATPPAPAVPGYGPPQQGYPPQRFGGYAGPPPGPPPGPQQYGQQNPEYPNPEYQNPKYQDPGNQDPENPRSGQ